MLASIGFTITGIFLSAFALSYISALEEDMKLLMRPFAYAYCCLALALFAWGFATAIGSPDALSKSVILGDTLIAIGSIFMVSIFRLRSFLVPLTFISALVLIILRIKYYYPEPYMKSDLLIFNTQTPIAIALAAIFSLIWLPANLKAATVLTSEVKLFSLRQLLFTIYALANISALIFISAQKPSIAALSFTAISICSLLLISFNLIIAKLSAQDAAR